MASIKLRRGSGVPSGLTFGEPAFDITNNRLYVGITGGSALVGVAGGGVHSFNGVTGAVTGVTTGTANTFGPLQSFTTGVSASGGLGVTGGATLNGNVRVNAANTLFLNKIESLSGSQVQIEDRASARVSLGDYSGAGQSTNIFIRDNINVLEISNPYGNINIGDPQIRNSGVYLSYSADLAELNGNGSSLTNFTSGAFDNITLTSGLCASGVSAGSYILTSSGIKSLTGTTYTFLTTDNGRILTFNNASAITVTIPTGLPVGFNCTAIQLGVGQVGFTSASGVTLQSYGNQYRLIGQHASATVIEYSTNIVNLSGNLIV